LKSLLGSGYLLTAAVDAYGTYFGQNIMGSTISAYFDQISPMVYSLGNTGDPNCNHQDAVRALGYWTGRGVPASKINLGVPFFGVDSGGTEMSYSAMCAADKWLPWFPPYTTSNSDNYYFDALADVQYKTELAMQQGAGVMVYTLDDDLLAQYDSLLTAIIAQTQVPPSGGCYVQVAGGTYQLNSSLSIGQCHLNDACNGGGNPSWNSTNCAKWATSASGAPAPWLAGQCYTGGVLQPAMTFARCQSMDSCAPGGGKASGTGCYKWAADPAGPAVAWP
jgi:hypothetical protein